MIERSVGVAVVLLLAACAGGEERATPAEADSVAATTPASAPAAPAPSVGALPRFEEHPAGDAFSGPPVPVRLESAAYGRRYRTVLSEGARSGPDFAGAYTVVLWGCGSACQIVAVVDARTGALSQETLQTTSGVRYRPDSRLLIADPVDPAAPPPEECASCGTPAAYLWTGTRFEPLGEGPHPHLSGPRPW